MRAWGWTLVAACAPGGALDDGQPPPVPAAPPILDARGAPPNVLLVVLDDVGPELVDAYDLAPDAPPTPTLSALAADGVRFTRAYSTPWCSPSRMALTTGRHPGREALGTAIELQRASGVDWSLPGGAWTVMHALRDDAIVPYGRGLAGKWHLTLWADGAATAALDAGYDHHRGAAANLQRNHASDGLDQGWYDWERLEDGQVSRSTTYATTADFDDAAWLVDTLDPPWFVHVGLRAAHFPYTTPPADLAPGVEDVSGDPAPATRAMLQAADTAFGRFLAGLDPAVRAHTVIVVIADNGTTASAQTGAWAEGRGGKSTVWEGGIRVPLIVSGAGIDGGRVDDALVDVLDVVPTVLDIAGVPAGARPALDGVSLWGRLRDPSVDTGRRFVVHEAFEPNGTLDLGARDVAIVDRTHKLVIPAGWRPALFVAGADVWLEGVDLLGVGASQADRAARDALRARLDDPQTRYRAW